MKNSRLERMELLLYRTLFVVMAVIVAMYTQKIANLLWGASALISAGSFGSSTLLFAYWYSRTKIEEAALCYGRIQDVEFWVHQDKLPTLYPLWGDLLVSEDISHEEIVRTLAPFSVRIETP
jgi:hypothetical protein